MDWTLLQNPCTVRLFWMDACLSQWLDPNLFELLLERLDFDAYPAPLQL